MEVRLRAVVVGGHLDQVKQQNWKFCVCVYMCVCVFSPPTLSACQMERDVLGGGGKLSGVKSCAAECAT